MSKFDIKSLSATFSDRVNELTNQGLFRHFNDIDVDPGAFPVGKDSRGRNIIDFSSSDYLGLSVNQKIMGAAKKAIGDHGVGSSGSNNLGGRHPVHTELEKAVALSHKKEKAILFNSAYDANIGVLDVLVRNVPEAVFLCDAQIHRSMIEPIRHTPHTDKNSNIPDLSHRYIFKHNDLDDLEKQLKRYPVERPKFILIEGIYSMDGSTPDFKKITTLAEKYGAIIYDDEVHSVGIYGKNGGGVCEEQNVMDKIGIIVGGFGKAHGVSGGYVASDKSIIELIKSKAPSYIFTSTLNQPTAAAALTAVKYLSAEQVPERQKHKENVMRAKQIFKTNDIPFLDYGHIITVVIKDANLAKDICRELDEKHGVLVRPVFYPSAPMGEAKLRIVVNARHTYEHIEKLASGLKSCLAHHRINGDRNAVAENGVILHDPDREKQI